MNWKNFFEPTNLKVKTTVAIMIFHYALGYMSGLVMNLLIPKAFMDIGKTFIENIISQNTLPIIDLMVTLVLSSAINFIILLIAAYITACIIAMIYKKK